MGMIKLPPRAIEFFKANVDEIFSSGGFAEGKWNQAFAEHVRTYCGCAAAVSTSSNGTGITALLQIFKAYYGRTRVMIQSNTMYGVKTMAITSGLHLVAYIDCSPRTLMPTLEDVQRAVSASGRGDDLVVLLSHIGGTINPDIEAIAEWCRQQQILLLEDCAHSYGATLRGRHSGTFGTAGVFSFYATKAIPAGEGGAAVTTDAALGSLVQKYSIYDRFDQKMDIGVNIRTSEVQALLALAAVKEVDEMFAKKRAIARTYMELCESRGIPFISQETEGQRGNYYKFIILGGPAAFPNLKTTTSPVYDYALGRSTEICRGHRCLPIWYGQPDEVTQKVVAELQT